MRYRKPESVSNRRSTKNVWILRKFLLGCSGRKDLALIGLERDEIIGAPFEDLADRSLFGSPSRPRYDAALETQRVEQFRDCVISFDLSPTSR